MKRSFIIALLLVICSFSASAQFDLQTRWSFMKGAQHPTIQLNYNGEDNLGETYIRTVFDLNYRDDIHIIEAPSVAFLNFERELLFWKKAEKWNRLSIHIGYQGGLVRDGNIKNAFSAGLTYKLLDTEKSRLDLKVMYKYAINTVQKVPMQISSRFYFIDPFNVEGLKLEGYADCMWQDHIVDYTAKMEKMTYPRTSHFSFVIAPQVWYNVGQFIGAKQLNVGGEVRLSLDYGRIYGFYCLPSAGIKWEF
ncbi:MAG: DUF5020 family protein [Bacteroidales bacterium]|nr:DUF5020 family protein [Bacteroidales bacterium]